MAASIVACATALVVGAVAWAVDYITPNYDWYTADPSASEFTITKAGELQAFSEIVNGLAYDDDGAQIGPDDFSDKTVKLGGSISLLNFLGDADYEFTPIGTQEHPFQGTFDGNGNRISAMTITEKTATEYVGLFGFCGSASTIQNVDIQDDCIVSIAATETNEAVRYVGGLAGCTFGSIQNCTSRAAVSVSWDDGNSGTERTTDQTEVVRNVGGVAGYIAGTLTNVRFTGSVDVSTSADATYDKADQTTDAIVARYVGGIAGEVGDVNWHSAAGKGDIVNCSNVGNVTLTTTGDGGKDRFGEVVESKGEYLGGIAGFACGNVSDCTNVGIIRGTAYVPIGNEAIDQEGYNSSAGGATSAGGIVGALRDGAADGSDPITLSDCANLGAVYSLNNVGGIVGEAGSYTTITRCANGDAAKVRRDDTVAQVIGTRWNKPCIGGIVGTSYGYVTYCRNHGEVYTTDIGYYVGGIVGNLSTYTNSAGYTMHPTPEVYASYNTGQVDCMESYRRGAIVGGNGGYVHDCAFLYATASVIDGDFSAIGQNLGVYRNLQTMYSSESEASEHSTGGKGALLKSKQAVAALNGACNADGWQTYYLLSTEANAGYPVLNTEAQSGSAVDLGSLNPQISLAENASYTAACNPEPQLDVTVRIGGEDKILVQNADYYVMGDASAVDAHGVCIGVTDTGTTPYTCTLVGIGDYTGQANGCAYGIVKGDFSECTVLVSEASYTGEAQNNPVVWVVDPAGGVVDPGSYVYTVNDGKDCIDPTNSSVARYPVVATARSSSNYYGSARGYYTIHPIDIARECDVVGIVYEGRVWYYDDERYQLYEVCPVLDSSGNLTYHEDTGFPIVEGEASYLSENGIVLTRATAKVKDEDGRTVYGMSQIYNADEINPEVIGVVWNGQPLDGYVSGSTDQEAKLKAWWQAVYGGGTGGLTPTTGTAGLKNIESSTTGAITVSRRNTKMTNYVVMNFDIEQLEAEPEDFTTESNFCYYAYNDGNEPDTPLHSGQAGVVAFNLLYHGNVVDPVNYELVPSYSVDNVTGAKHSGDSITYNAGDTVHYDVRFVEDGSIACEDIQDAVVRTIIGGQMPFDGETFEVVVDSSPCVYNFDGCPAPIVTVTNRQTGEVLVKNTDYTYAAYRSGVGTWDLVVQGIGRYAGSILTTYTISEGLVSSDLFGMDGVANDYDAKIANTNVGSIDIGKLALVFPWRANGYSEADLESSLGIAWKLKGGYGLNPIGAELATLCTNSGKLFTVSNLRTGAGEHVDAITEPGRYRIHLSYREGADANYYGARYFNLSEDFSLDVNIYVTKVNLSNSAATTHPLTGTTVNAYQFYAGTLRLKYRQCYRGAWAQENFVDYDASIYPYTGNPVIPRMQVMDSSHIGWYLERGENPADFALPQSEFDVEVEGYGTTGPVEVNDFVTNPYYVGGIVAKAESEHLVGRAAVETLTYDDCKFAIVAADLSESDIVDIKVDEAVYTGAAVEPTVHFFIDGEECSYVEGEDFALEYTNNVNAGHASDDNPPIVRVRILNRTHLTAHDADGNTVDFVDVPFDIAYRTVAFSDVDWKVGELNALAESSSEGVLEAAAITGTYAHPDGSGERLEVPENAFTLEAGTVAAASPGVEASGLPLAAISLPSSEQETDAFTAKENGWRAGDSVWYRITAVADNPAFAGTVVVGPATVTGFSAANSLSFIGEDGCILSVVPAGAGEWTFGYTGAQVRPDVIVSDGQKQLVEGVDYGLSFGENLDAGIASGTVTVCGRGAYTGTYTQSFAISQASLQDCVIAVDAQTFAGKGVQVRPDPSQVHVLLGDVELPDSDWILDVSGFGANDGVGADAGELHITFNGSGNVKAGTLDAAFDIDRLGLNSTRFSVTVNSQRTYTGAKQTLGADDIAVTDTETGDVLEYGTDFTLNYLGDHEHAGDATVLVSGLGCYADSLSANFSIAPADLSSAIIKLDDDSYAYTGAAVRPLPASVTIDLDDGSGTVTTRSLEECYTTATGETFGEYTLSYLNNVAVATADAESAPTVVIRGSGNFTGVAYATFGIEGGAMSNANTTITPEALSFVYNGNDICPAVEVRYNGRVIPSSDYTVSYTGNRNPGTATVTVTGTGVNLAGSASTTFDIVEADLAKATIAPIPDAHYAFGNEVCPVLFVTGVAGEELELGVDYVASYSDNRDLGTAHVVISPAEGSAYTGQASATFQIVKIPIARSDVRLSADEFTYDGLTHVPEVSIVVGGRTLVESADYALSWPDDLVSLGGKAIEVVTPSSSYYTSEVVVVYRIVEDDSSGSGSGADAGDGGSGGSESGGSDSSSGGGSASAPVVSAGTAVTISGAQYLVTGTGSTDTARTLKLVKGVSSAKAVIPDMVKLADGKAYRVTAVSAGAFASSKATSLIVGKYVKSIPANAFKNMKKLKSVVIGASVASIGNGAFTGCAKLKTITVKSKKLAKKSVKGCFKGAKKLKTVKVKVGNKKVNKKFVKKYKKVFTKKNCGKKVTVK